MKEWDASHPGQKIAFVVGLDRTCNDKPQVVVHPASIDVPQVSHDFSKKVMDPDDFRDEVKLLLSNFEMKMRLDAKHASERRALFHHLLQQTVDIESKQSEEIVDMESRHKLQLGEMKALHLQVRSEMVKLHLQIRAEMNARHKEEQERLQGNHCDD